MTFDVHSILKTISSFKNFSKEIKEDEATSSDTGGSTQSTGAKQWESGRKMGKTYGGSKYVWNSDRAMGKTYQGNPKYKWESGASRGKANPLT